MGQDALNSQRVQFVVPPGGVYAVFGNTLAPSFTSADFESIDCSDRCKLAQRVPVHASHREADDLASQR